ncbi:hypothetical protein HQO27_18220 [Rhodococcus fascians]|nr:hypothetical protein [Rhodococcus fascians]MBY4432706.1 hypothetical protein [Rhodococcus fascians]
MLSLFHATDAASARSVVSNDLKITNRDRMLGRSMSTPSATHRATTNSSKAWRARNAAKRADPLAAP